MQSRFGKYLFSPFVFALSLQAGGFFVQLGNPEANPAAHALNAVLTFKPAGCHEPEKATITARAIPVEGVRTAPIVLNVTPLSGGEYALTRQWPDSGKWLIQVTARSEGRVTNALVPARGNDVDRNAAKYLMREVRDSEVAALFTTPAQTALK